MLIKNKKAQESLVSNKLITMILIILVIVLLSFILFRPEILDWMRNIPGYEVENTEIDQSGIPTDQLALGCSQEIALIGSKQLGIIFGRNSRDLSIFLENKTTPALSRIYVANTNERVWLLRISKSWYQGDLTIGQIAKGILTINPDIIQNYASSEVKNYVSLEELNRINGSFLYTTTKLCKP